MRIAFMGTPQFAADILEDIHERVDVVCVFTRPDAVRGRGKKLEASPVKKVAKELGIEVFTPHSLKGTEILDILGSYDLDAIVVAAYGMILPKAVLDLPRLGCFNVHASALPRWRGAAPIERAILAGDESAGVCIMEMEEGLDTGRFCISRTIPIDDMGTEKLTSELASLGAVALISALAHIESGHAHWVCQDESKVTYAEKIAKGELNLDPHERAIQNLRRIKASSVAHPAKCVIASRTVAVIDAALVDMASCDAQTESDMSAERTAPVPGDVIYQGKKLFLACADGWIELYTVKPDGKSVMDAKSFVAGCAEIRDGSAKWGAVHAG